MHRRHFLSFIGSMTTSTLTTLTGCNMSRKRNIKSFGKTYGYLQDPARRTRETGDALLTIENAEFSGVDFQGQTWRNVKFVDCDFAGGYEIKLERLEKSLFENCKFVGIHSFGDMVDVRLFRCAVGGESYLMGYSDTKRLIFEQCNFIGTKSDRNHWGAVGGYGEAEFVQCKAKWFDLSGHMKLTIIDCELESVSSKHDPREVEGRHAAVLIERSKLLNSFDMIATNIQSFTIRDTVIDGTLDLSNATVKGDILIERVRGGSVKAIVRGAQRLVVKSSRFTPSVGVEFEFKLASNDAREVLIEDTSILGENLVADIGGGPQTLSTIFRNTQITELDLQYIHTAYLLLQGLQADRVLLSDARIGQLEFSMANFARSLDLSGTQVKSFKQTGGTALRKFGGLKIDGSNIKLPG
jgi:uncharacterized protein YjbI with pentapeptide repeats